MKNKITQTAAEYGCRLVHNERGMDMLKRILAFVLATMMCTGTVFAKQKLYVSPEIVAQMQAEGQNVEEMFGDEYEIIITDNPTGEIVGSASYVPGNAPTGTASAKPQTEGEIIAAIKEKLAHLNIVWQPDNMEIERPNSERYTDYRGGVFYSWQVTGDQVGLMIYPKGSAPVFMEGITGSFTDIPYAMVRNSQYQEGAIDQYGNFTIPFGRYECVGSGFVGNGRIIYVENGGLMGLADITAGEELLPCQYEFSILGSAYELYDYNLEKYFDEEGLLPLGKNGKWGFVNRQMQVVIPFQYDHANEFSDGYALVRKGNRQYIINRNGDTVGQIPAGYEGVRVSEGLVCICAVDSWPLEEYGYCDLNGNMVIQPQFSKGDDFQDGVAIVFNGKPACAVIDRNGNFVVPFGIYDNIMRSGDRERLFCYLQRANPETGALTTHMYYYSTTLMGTDGTIYVDKSIAITPGDQFENGVVAYHDMKGYENEWGRESYGYIDRFGNVTASFDAVVDSGLVDSVELSYSKVSVKIKRGNTIYGYLLGYYPPQAATVPQTDAPQQANYTGAKILVNGKQVAPEVYNINDNNYFKLRDLAKLVSGSGKQFEVTYDNARNAINLMSGKAYTTVGGELAAGDGSGKTATPNASPVFKNGASLALAAYTIDGYNYFKLRDICRAFDIGVTWDEATQTVGIDTSIGYTE
ncbi:MAG: hypothetical protein E7409_06810 [Ruminococcaceae bacterium]|nr:hypothetical protein [Oscillospiraceae bacterium]